MALGTIILFFVVHIVLIWFAAQMKKSKHKIIALFLIALSIFGYLSFSSAFGEKEVDLTDFDGVVEAGGVYFSWLGSVFGNVQTITSNVIENNSRENIEK